MTTINSTDSLSDLSRSTSLDAAQVSDYQRDGHTLVRGLISADELAPYRRAIVEAADRESGERRPIAERDTYGKAFLQIMNLWQKDEIVKRFTLAERFANVAAELMGVSGARIYHDQALFKEPNGGPTPWHQDQHYWPLDTDNTITMWMPLVDIPAEVGSMSFGSTSHKFGYLGDLPISDKSQAEIGKFIADRDIPVHSYGAMKAGDATFHAGWTLHSAPGNPTSLMREVMTIIYFADGTRAKEPENRGQKGDFCWMPGAKPGDFISTELNPLVSRL